jgi:hypothetical protein
VLATLGQGDAAADEASEAVPLFGQAPAGDRARLAPRIDLLRSWAEKTGRTALARDLAR